MTPFVVFDTETTGLPLSYASANARNTANWNTCRLVQLAWEIYTSADEEPVSSGNLIVAPHGFAIPEQASRIHGITTERAIAEGRSINEVLETFLSDIKKHGVETAVAHNISFDENVLLSELLRAGIRLDEWQPLYKHCTMLKGTKKGCRWPKLHVLYENTVGPLPESVKLHSADVDTALCAAIYKKQMVRD